MYFLTLVKEELLRQNISFDGKLVLDTIHRLPFSSHVTFNRSIRWSYF